MCQKKLVKMAIGDVYIQHLIKVMQFVIVVVIVKAALPKLL